MKKGEDVEIGTIVYAMYMLYEQHYTILQPLLSSAQTIAMSALIFLYKSSQLLSSEQKNRRTQRKFGRIG